MESIAKLPNEYSIDIDDFVPSVFEAPVSNAKYAEVSGDTNPIHVNSYYANFAKLPVTITHGMWTSAATRKYLDVIVAENQPVKSYEVQFVEMVCLENSLRVKFYHTGMRDGANVIRIEPSIRHREKVLVGTILLSVIRKLY